MPVDRAKRDSAAAALAEYLRGESDRNSLKRVFTELEEVIEDEGFNNPGSDRSLEAMIARWNQVVASPTPITEEIWLKLCRDLAFLKTDLEVKSLQSPEDPEEISRDIFLARWHILGLVVALGVAYLTHWWIFLVAMLISVALFQTLGRKPNVVPAEEKNPSLKWHEFGSFEDQTEWLAHQHLLDDYNLPPFDPNAFEEPQPTTKRTTIVDVLLMSFFGLLIALAVAFAIFSLTLIWPVFLVSMAFRRRIVV